MLESVDHVTVAGSDLTRLDDAFVAAGLDTEYGGTHSNGTTHMSVVGFGDGSYIELFSTCDGAEEAFVWDAHVQADGGPCGWSVAVTDLDRAAERVRDRGIVVEGPTVISRDRPDGVTVEFAVAFLGDGEPGSTIPFLIEDRTPRHHRVAPTGDLADSPLSGVERVVVGVADLDAAIETFRTAFDLPVPERGRVDADPVDFSADTAWFPSTSVILAEPRGGWLEARIARFGACPSAVLLGTADLAAAADRLPLTEGATRLADGRVHWVPPAELDGVRYLGVYADDSR